MLEIIVILSALVLLAIGSFTDFRSREVPDFVSYSAIAFGLGVRIIASIVTQSYTPLIEGAIGFGALLLVALLMYYTGQWGGGDSKVIMGLGMLIGAAPTLSAVPTLGIFLINMLLIGSIYGLIYTFVLAIMHRKRFLSSFKQEFHRRRLVKWISYLFAALLIIAALLIKESLFKLLFVMLAAAFILLFYMWIFIKAIELSVMVKRIPIERLTEGDWIVDKIVIDKKYICGPKDLGIEKKQIQLLLKLKRQGKIDTIKVKEGIPFVPGFFLAFIATLIFGNWLNLIFYIY